MSWQTIKAALEHEESSDLNVMLTDVRFHDLMAKIHKAAGNLGAVRLTCASRAYALTDDAGQRFSGGRACH